MYVNNLYAFMSTIFTAGPGSNTPDCALLQGSFIHRDYKVVIRHCGCLENRIMQFL